MRYASIGLIVMLAGCTAPSIEHVPGNERLYTVTNPARCVGLCSPSRPEPFKAMHEKCSWPAVPAIHVRGHEPNGILGVPHAEWRFTCLTVGS